MAKQPLRITTSTGLALNKIKDVLVKGRLRLEKGVFVTVEMHEGREGHPLSLTLHHKDPFEEAYKIELGDCIGLQDIPEARLDLGALRKLSQEHSLLGSLLLVYAYVIGKRATLTIAPSPTRDPTHVRFSLDVGTYMGEESVPLDDLKGLVAIRTKGPGKPHP